MTAIVVDPDQLRWKATVLEVFLGSLRRAQRDIAEATAMATGYEGQLRRQVMAIAGHDESMVRALANDLEEMIARLRQIAGAFEAADAVGASDAGLGQQFRELIDQGLLLSSLPSNGQYGDLFLDPESRLWAMQDPEQRELLTGGVNGWLWAFVQSPLYPSGGTEADYWQALHVFLYVSGATQAQPSLASWQAAAGASGVELPAYVSTATGVNQTHVGSWLQAAETHQVGLDTAIGEIVDMALAEETIEQHFGFAMPGNWSESDQDDIVEAVVMISYALAGASPAFESAGEAFQSVFGGVEFTLQGGAPDRTWYCTGSGSGMACAPGAYDRISPQTIAHELGHSFNARVVNNLNRGLAGLDLDQEERDRLTREVNQIRPYGELSAEQITAEVDGETVHVAGRPPEGGYQRTDLGYASLEFPWQQHSIRWGNNDPSGNTANEDFADMFLGWAYDGFADDPAGQARYEWMQSHMAEWIEQAFQPVDLAWFGEPVP